MDREVFVYVDLQGTPYLAGRLWARLRKGRETATFEYDRSWLAHGERFSLEPALKLGPGPFHTAADRRLFGAIGDSAPDRWGRVLMRRAERRLAECEGQGALRFSDKERGPFLADQSPNGIPPLRDRTSSEDPGHRTGWPKGVLGGLTGTTL